MQIEPDTKIVQTHFSKQAVPLSLSNGVKHHLAGFEHLDTIQSLNSLAVLYRKQGKYAQAASLFQHALLIREKELETDHPTTQTTR